MSEVTIAQLSDKARIRDKCKGSILSTPPSMPKMASKEGTMMMHTHLKLRVLPLSDVTSSALLNDLRRIQSSESLPRTE